MDNRNRSKAQSRAERRRVTYGRRRNDAVSVIETRDFVNVDIHNTANGQIFLFCRTCGRIIHRSIALQPSFVAKIFGARQKTKYSITHDCSESNARELSRKRSRAKLARLTLEGDKMKVRISHIPTSKIIHETGYLHGFMQVSLVSKSFDPIYQLEVITDGAGYTMTLSAQQLLILRDTLNSVIE